jgi:hypothetical protein
MPTRTLCQEGSGDAWHIVFDQPARTGAPDLWHEEWRCGHYDDPNDERLQENEFSGGNLSEYGDGDYMYDVTGRRRLGLPVGWRLSVLSHDLDAAIYSARVRPLILLPSEW